MKFILITSLFFIVSCSSVKEFDEEVTDAWETEMPVECREWNTPAKIDEKLIFEVSKSSFDFASYYLSNSDSLTLTNNEVKEYLGYVPTLEGNIQPYLVRALYGHSGTGAFHISWCREGIAITHESLGGFSIINRTAFVLYLTKSPAKMYLEVSIDE